MQSAGQYHHGVNEVQQFVVGGGSSQQHPAAAPHLFSLGAPHDLSSVSSPSGAGSGHSGSHPAPGHHRSQQQQQLYAHHLTTHQPQAHATSSHSSQQQRQHQQQVVQQQQTVQHLEHPAMVMQQSTVSAGRSADLQQQPPQQLGHESLLVQGNLHDAAADDGFTEGEEGGFRGTPGSAAGNRWPRQETLLLIKIRSEMDSNFRDSGLKGPLWEDVARKLSELGYNRSSKKCKEKFENIHKYYKKTKHGKAGRQDGKNYRFFSELDALHSGRSSTHDTAAAARLMQQLPAAAGSAGHGITHIIDDADAVTAAASPSAAFRAAAAAVKNVGSAGAAGFAAVSDSSGDRKHEEHAGRGESEDDDTIRSCKKRKRKDQTSAAATGAAAGRRTSSCSNSKKVMLLESLVKKLMDKQEAMQRKFLESMERREQDRIAREEAWKSQEMDRMIREHELRTREHTLAASRDAALVAVLQKVTGQTLQLPQLPPPPPPRGAPPPYLPASVHTSTATTVEAPHIQVDQHHHHHRRAQQQQQQQQHEDVLLQEVEAAVPDKDHHGSFSDPHSKRWPTPEVHALIRLRIEMDSKFHETGGSSKGPLWEEISRGMSSLGYSFRNAKRCKEKWENVNKYYKKTKESNRKRPDNSKTCPYFPQLEALYRNGGSRLAAAAGGGTTTSYKQQMIMNKLVDEQDSEGLQPDHLQQNHMNLDDGDDDDDDDDDDSTGGSSSSFYRALMLQLSMVQELQLKEVLPLQLVMAQLHTHSQFSGNHSKLQLKRLNPYPNDTSSRSSTNSRESLNLGVQTAPPVRIVDTATAAARD